MLAELCRVGQDPELRYLPSGTPVLALRLVYDVMVQREKKGQWVEAAIFGARAEKVQPYIKKGDQLFVTLSDVHVREYEHNGVNRSQLQGSVADFKFVSNRESGGESRAPAPQRSAPAPTQSAAPAAAAPAPAEKFDPELWEDDIPF